MVSLLDAITDFLHFGVLNRERKIQKHIEANVDLHGSLTLTNTVIKSRDFAVINTDV